MQKTLSPQSTVQERRLLFNASLQLISRGRFLNATMQEIAYQAHMSEATVAYIFENRTHLLYDLIEHTSSGIYAVMDEWTRAQAKPFKVRFFDLWKRLHQYYTAVPDLPAFLQQFDVLSKNAKSLCIYPGYYQPLIDFFNHAPAGVIDVSDAETLAYIFHENVLTSAQLKTRAQGRAGEIHAHMPEMLWKYLAGEVRQS